MKQLSRQQRFLLCAVSLMLAFSVNGYAQFRGLRDKVKQKVKDKIEQKVDRTIDKVIDGAENEMDNTINDAVKGKEKEKEKGKHEKKEGTAEVNASVTQNKSDFVQGAVVLFEDNFAGEQLGEFPSQWDLEGGSVEVAQIGDRKVAKFTQNATIFPLMKKNQYNYLPEEFTIEWDIYIADEGETMNHELRLKSNEEGINTHNNSCVFVEITYRPSDQWTRVDWNCQKPTQGNSRGEQELTGKLKSGWNHIAVSFNQRAFKLYVNDERLCNVPNVLAPKYMEYESVNSEGYPYSCISNVRIGQGAVALYDRNASDIDKAMAETGKFVTNNILFDTGKATLKPESMAEIQKVADYMKKNPTVRFEVQGHTDNQGSDKINDPLSKQRAEAIVKALASLGVDDFNLKAVGKGSHEPVADNKTEEGRAKNRRVEFIKR